ncbi:MAG: regulatory protein RecX [Acidobacteriota bacterium]
MPEDLERCYTAAMRILNHRFNSESELRRKLAGKKFEHEEIAATIARLRDEKWLDDTRFADAFVRTRVRKRIGRLRIRRELSAAGVDHEVAADALRRNVDAEGEREAATATARKRALILARRDGEEYVASAEGRNKLSAYLLKQGYDGALIRDVVREVIKEIAVADHQ